jgi:hypothetical protein
VLSKEQQKSIFGGSGPCQVYIDGDVWIDFSVSDAQHTYQVNKAAGRDARYCCASCPDRAWAQQTQQ